MSLWQRLLSIIGMKALSALDQFEEPPETLEAAYQTQVHALQECRHGIADVLTAEKRLEIEVDSLRESARYLRATAAKVFVTNEAVARHALERAIFAEMQRERLLAQSLEIRAQRVALQSTAEQLHSRAESFRTEKIAVGARYVAAKATMRAGETIVGLSKDMHDVGQMVERARDKSRAAQARAAALAQLAQGDSLSDDQCGVDPAHIDAELVGLRRAALHLTNTTT
jgi:phage shock protein A